MGASIDSAYISTFEDNVRHLAQQANTKLRGWCQEIGVDSKEHSFERLGAVEALEKTGRLVATPVQNAPWSRRVVTSSPFHAGDSTEKEDPSRMLVDPNSNLTMALSMGMRRKVDDRLIAAATSTALNGDGSTTAYDYTNQATGAYTAPISFDLVTAVQEIFMNRDIDPEIPKIAVVGPTQVRKLMQLTENTSRDYVQAQALQQYGIVPNWLGFTWINSTRLLTGGDTGGGAGTKDILFYTARALGLKVNSDITARVQEDPSVSFAWRIYCYADMGAVRVEDEQMVVGRVKDAIS